MPYPPGHGAAVRGKIVQSARRLFNRYGFDNVSLSQIMSGAGLTRGGFYNYFSSKSDLYTEVLNCFFTDPEWKNHWEGVEIDPSRGDLGPQIIRAYLSNQHFDDVENSCPMVALPSDVARNGEEPRHAFETAFRGMVELLEGSMAETVSPRHIHAQAVAAMCVGGMIVARTIADRGNADQLREACMMVALKLGEWESCEVSNRPYPVSTAR